MQKLSAGKFHERCSTNLAPLPTNNNIEKRPDCLLLAHSGHCATEFQCPLLGRPPMSAFDPKRTLLPSDIPLTLKVICGGPLDGRRPGRSKACRDFCRRHRWLQPTNG